MERLIGTAADGPAIAAMLALGLNHEQQHQELLLTDIKHVLFCNPLAPAYRAQDGFEQAGRPAGRAAPPLRWVDIAGGVQETGRAGDGFEERKSVQWGKRVSVT